MQPNTLHNDKPLIKDTDLGMPPGFCSEFRDVPNSTEHGSKIAYADVVLWIASGRSTGTIELPSEELYDAAEREICSRGAAGELTGLGYAPGANKLKALPEVEWLDLYISMVDGQPDADHQEHGGRMYGAAYRRDPADAWRLEEAWTGLCFRKSEILNLWPAVEEDGTAAEPNTSAGSASAADIPTSATLAEASLVRRRGRRPGDGSYQTHDQPLIHEMDVLLDEVRAKSVLDAASIVAGKHKAHQGNSRAAVISRLRKGYRKVFLRSEEAI